MLKVMFVFSGGITENYNKLYNSRAGNFLLNSLVPLDKCGVYFTCPDHKTTCPKNWATAIQGLKNYFFISTMSQLANNIATTF